MKKTLRTIMMGMMTLLAVGALSSCSNDDELQIAPEEAQKGYVEFSLSRGADTRTAYALNDAGGLDVTWSEGDQMVVVYNLSSEDEIVEVFTLKDGAGTKTATFSKSDSKLVDKSSDDMILIHYPGYDDSKDYKDNNFIFSKQTGSLESSANYDFFEFTASLKNGQITITPYSFSSVMNVFHFKANDIDFGVGGGTKDFVFSGGYAAFGYNPPSYGDITIKDVSLNDDGTLINDLYVFGHFQGMPTTLTVGEKCYKLPKTNEQDQGIIYTFAQSNLKKVEAKLQALTLEPISEDVTVTISNPLKLSIGYYIVNTDDEVTLVSTATTETITIGVKKGQRLQLFGDNAAYASNWKTYTNIQCSADCYIYGNIMSLIDSEDYATETKLTADHALAWLFKGNKKIQNHPDKVLTLPATTLTNYCYNGLFQNCTSLTTAPALPATTLASNCYDCMFDGCSSLKSAPALPATELANICYAYMFRYCSSLTDSPALPAETLAEECYYHMFEGCKKVTSAPALPAKTLARKCYSGMFESCINLKTAPALPATTLASNCYDGMFRGCSSLTDAPKLPATTLADYCYASMFSGCSSLTDAPELQATELANYCYAYMFSGCTSLASSPALPAETLADHCYAYMFRYCSSLTDSPALPATKLKSNCYNGMFADCTGLTKAPELPATTLTDYCYAFMFIGCRSLMSAPELPAKTLKGFCYQQMFSGCTSLESAPELPATELSINCYQLMFRGCTSLVSAPLLPATKLNSYCYEGMFKGCENLSSVTCLATEIPDDYDCTKDWLNGVASEGTFTKAADMTGWEENSASGIPSGWTVKNYGE